MNFNLFFTNRSQIFGFLIVSLIIFFPLGFLIDTVLIYLFLIFFFLDYKKNISSKLRSLIKCKEVHLYLLFFVVQLLGLFYSDNLSMGIKRSIQLLPFVFLPGIIIIEGRNFNFRKVYFFLQLGIPAIFIIIGGFYCFSDSYNGMNNLAQNWFVNKIGISQFYLIFILLLPILITIKFLFEKSIIFNLSIIIISSYFIVLMNNFSGLIFLAVTLIIFFRKLFFKIKIIHFVPLIVGFSAILFSLILINTKLEKKFFPLLASSIDFEQIRVKNKFGYTRDTFEQRLYIDYLIISNWKDTFPVGLGTGDPQPYLNKLYSENSFLFGIQKKLNAHNQYLQEYLKTGIIGITVLMILFFNLLKISKRAGSIFCIYILFFAFACLVESYLNRFHGIIICSGIIPFLLNDKNHEFS